MIKGFGGSESWFRRYDFPVWVYVLNILLMLVVVILAMESIFSTVPVIGTLSIDDDRVIVNKRGRLSKFRKTDLMSFTIKQNFSRGRVVGNLRTYVVHFRTSELDIEFELQATQEDEERIKLELG